jgi:hypothetical protein
MRYISTTKYKVNSIFINKHKVKPFIKINVFLGDFPQTNEHQKISSQNNSLEIGGKSKISKITK